MRARLNRCLKFCVVRRITAAGGNPTTRSQEFNTGSGTVYTATVREMHDFELRVFRR